MSISLPRVKREVAIKMGRGEGEGAGGGFCLLGQGTQKYNL